MAYKTKREKQAYKTGLLNGLKRKKDLKRSSTFPGRTGKSPYLKKTTQGKSSSRKNNPFGMSYGQMLREDEQRKREFLGDFDYDSRGRIKGSYTPDGRFEPD